MAGELTGDDAGHSEVGRGHGWTQRRVAVRVEVVDVTGVAWLAGDEVSRRRGFGRRRLRPFPAAKEAGKKGEMVRGARGFQIEAEEERGRHVPRELWRAEVAELKLDLEFRRSGGKGWCGRLIRSVGER